MLLPILTIVSQLIFADGIFGNAAYGNYRIWYRKTENENFTVNRNDISEVAITIPYIGGDDRPYDLTVTHDHNK